MKKIIILHNKKQFDKYCSVEKNFIDNSSIKILAYTIDIRIFLKSKNIPYLIYEEFISDEISKKLYKLAYYFNDNWHKNQFKFMGFSLATINQGDTVYYFNRILKYIELFLGLIKKEKPSKIIAIEESYDNYLREFNNCLKYICNLKEIKLEFIKIEREKLSISLIERIIYTKPYKLSLKIIREILWMGQKLKNSLFDKNKKKILMCRIKYHRSVFQMLLQKYNVTLLELENLNPIESLQTLFSKKNYSKKSIRDYETHKIRKRVENYYNKLIKRWISISKTQEFRQFFVYNDINFWPLFRKRLNSLFFLIYRNRIRYILTLYKMLTKDKYDLIIFDTDVKARTMILSVLALRLKIPTLVIQHGAFVDPVGMVPSFAKKFATWGEISKDALIKYKMNPDQIKITGVPRFDEYIRFSKSKMDREQIKKDVYKDFNLEPDKRLIVFATAHGHYYKIFVSNINYSHLEIEKMYFMVLKAIKNLPDSHLIIKLHPSDPTKGFIPLQMIKEMEIKNVSVVSKYNFVNLLVACNYFITGYSTTLLEAMLLEKPLIVLLFHEGFDEFPFLKYKAAYKAENYEQLLERIRDCQTKPLPLENYRRFLKDYIYKIDGQSTLRVVKLIEDLISKS